MGGLPEGLYDPDPRSVQVSLWVGERGGQTEDDHIASV